MGFIRAYKETPAVQRIRFLQTHICDLKSHLRDHLKRGKAYTESIEKYEKELEALEKSEKESGS